MGRKMTSADSTKAPEGWTVSTLGATAHLVKDKIDPFSVPGDTPYIGLEHVQAHSMKLLGNGRASDVKSIKTRFKAGDVLYGKLRPYLNKVARPDFDGICSTDFLVFNESPELDRGYLAHYLNQLWVADRAHHVSTGVELPRVDWASLSEFPIVYPVGKAIQVDLIKAIERSARLRMSAASHLKLSQRAIMRFRQAVLAAACSGRLTADWRSSHSEGAIDELIRQIESERLQVKGSRSRPAVPIAESNLPDIPDTWRWMSIDSLSRKVVDGVHKTPEYVEHGIPFITVKNLTAGPGISFESCKYVREEDHRVYTERTRPQRGDILISKDGTLGVTRAIRTDKEFSIFVSVAMVKPVLYEMTDYLELALSSPQVQKQMVGVGSGLVHLVLRDLKADGVPVPPIDEQREIVRRVNRLINLANEVHLRIGAAVKRTERSSQAVLTKAFRGELLPSAIAPEMDVAPSSGGVS
jgi:Type I restriction modification DNA specificity domain